MTIVEAFRMATDVSDRPVTRCGEWVTDGMFAVRANLVHGDWPVDDRAESKAAALDRLAATGPVLSEVPDLRTDPPDCEECGGTGNHVCYCGCQHGCGYCNATGKDLSEGGQIVFRSSHGMLIAIHTRFEPLVRCASWASMSLSQSGTSWPASVLLHGSNGYVIAIVMPLSKVRLAEGGT